MKLLFVVTSGGHGYSFTRQAVALKAAAEAVNAAQTRILTIGDAVPSGEDFEADVVIPVGSWVDYDRIIAPPLAKGRLVLPWIVSDPVVDKAAIDKLNAFPWFLTTSEYCRSIFVRDGIESEKVKVLYECVDEDFWRPLSGKETAQIADLLSVEEADGSVMQARSSLRAARKRGTPILFTTGGDATSKGALEIITALSKLPPSLEWLYIIKTWPSAGSLRISAKELDLAAKYNLTDRIKYLIGEYSDNFMVGLMNLCDIYVAASRSEGFGLPLVEAQMCGKMVVTHRSTSTKEVIVEGETGLSAGSRTTKSGEPRADVASLAKQLHRAIADKTLREQFSVQARPTAIDRFGKQAIGTHFLKLVNDYLEL